MYSTGATVILVGDTSDIKSTEISISQEERMLEMEQNLSAVIQFLQNASNPQSVQQAPQAGGTQNVGDSR